MIEIYETIKNCRICSSKNIKEVLDLGDQPPANSLFKAIDEVPPRVPLRLMYCQNCSTVQLGEDVDPEYLFSQYLWVTGTSNAAIDHSHEFTKKALSKLDGANIKPYVVEIASDDGTFLKRFIENGCKVLGVDPATNIAELANKNGVPTNANFFTVELAKQLVNKLAFVGTPFLLASSAIFVAGSTPKTLQPFSIKRFKKVPSSLAISTTYGLILAPSNLLRAFFVNSWL
jgi:hypothetical protein